MSITPILKTGLVDATSEVVSRIIAAAECTFAGSGYSAASMREIAEVAAVSKSLLHYHFQSKEHLFLEVQVRIYNRLAARITAAVAGHTEPRARTLLAVDALFSALRENPDFEVQARVWARSLSDEALVAHARRMRAHLRERLIDTMTSILGPAAEDLPVAVPVLADLVWAAVTGLGLMAASDPAPDRVDRAFAELRRLLSLALPPSDEAP